MQPVNFQRLCELSGSLLTQILFYVFPFTSIKMPFLTGLLIVFEFFFLFDKLNYLLPVSSSKWSFPFNIKPSDLITPHTYVSTQPPVMMFPPLFQLILCQTIDQKLLHFLSCLISDSWQCVGHRVFSSWSWWEHSPINTSWPQRQDRLLAKEEALAACLSSAFGGHGRRTYGWWFRWPGWGKYSLPG